MAIRIGKAPKGKVYHVIMGTAPNIFPVCDKRKKGYVVDPNVDATAISCGKCLKRKEVRTVLEKLKDVVKKPPAKPAPKKEKPATAKKPEKKKIEPEPLPDEFEMVEKKNGKYKINHLPSGKVFFDDLPETVILEALESLCSLDLRWNGKEGMLPEGFISECRRCVREAYEKAGGPVPSSLIEKKKPKKKPSIKRTTTRKFKKGERLEINDVLHEFDGKEWKAVKPPLVAPSEEKQDKPARKIKRRKKVERVIKRRPATRKIKRTKRKKIAGCRKGTPGYTICEAMLNGSTLNYIVKVVKATHDLDKTEARNKVKRTIRVLRKKGYRMSIDLGNVSTKDVYTLRLGGNRPK